MIRPSVYLADTKTVLEGSSVLTLPCYAEGVPTPNVTWESLDVSIDIKITKICSTINDSIYERLLYVIYFLTRF